MQILIKNKKTEYSIYVPDNSLEEEKGASLLLKKYLDLAFDLDIKIVNEKPEKYIQIVSDFVEGISVKDLGNSLLLCGFGKYGPYDIVVDFLSRFINFDVIDESEILFDKPSNLIIEQSYSYMPSFKYRVGTYGWIRTNNELKRLTHTISNDELYIGGNRFHDVFDILRYGNKEIKDEWLSKDKKQLCFSNTKMREAFINNLQDYLLNNDINNLDNKYFVIGMEDNTSWCECDKCSLISESDLMVDFLNFVEENINRNRKEKIIFMLFAYYHTLKAPTKVKCNDNVGVIFAPIKARFIEKLNSSNNKKYCTELNKWKCFTNHLFAWTYNFYTRRNLISYNTFNSMSFNYRILSSNNVQYLYDQTESYSFNQTGFCKYKAYLQQHLLWNAKEKTKTLFNKYFDTYFKEFSDSMKKIFSLTISIYKYLYKKEKHSKINSFKEFDPDFYSEIGQCIDKFKFFKSKKVCKFLDKTNNDFELLLKKAKNNEILYKRILVESFQYRYLWYLLNPQNTNGYSEFLDNLKSEGVTHFGEGKEICKEK